MGRLWDIVQGHIDASPYPPSLRQVATKLGVSPTALGNWREVRRLPERENLRRLAVLARVPYADVLEAALSDAGYLDDPDGGAADRYRLMDVQRNAPASLPGRRRTVTTQDASEAARQLSQEGSGDPSRPRG